VPPNTALVRAGEQAQSAVRGAHVGQCLRHFLEVVLLVEARRQQLREDGLQHIGQEEHGHAAQHLRTM